MSTGIIFLLLTAGFLGILVIDGILDQPSVSAATTRYVGGTGVGNYSTIQDAIDAAASGDTIRVYAGTYFENVEIDKTISLIGNGSTNTTINGGGIGDVVFITANKVNVTGFKITNSGSRCGFYFDAGIEIDNVFGVTLAYNNCSLNKHGIFITQSNNNYVKHNEIYSNDHEGISLYLSSSYNKIENNNFTLNLDGIFGFGYTNYILYSNSILNNTFTNNDEGICTQYSRNFIIRNNTCINNTQMGIHIKYSNNNIRENNICYNNRYGIYTSNSNYDVIKNNTCYNNRVGIHTINSNYDVIKNNTCYNNKFAIYNNNSNDILIKNNTCNYNYAGVAVWNDINDVIKNNTCNFNDWNLVSSKSVSILIEDNYCSEGTSGSGIQLQWAESNIVHNNTMTECTVTFNGDLPKQYNSHSIDISNNINGEPVYYWKSRSGGKIPSDAGQVILVDCTNVDIENLDFQGWGRYVKLAFSNENRLRNNSFSNNYGSIGLLYSNENRIINNTIIMNHRGIYLNNSNKNLLKNNNCSNNILSHEESMADGLEMVICKENEIEDNIFSGNGYAGIELDDCSNNLIVNNTISNNNIYGILINHSDSNTIKNNIISKNNRAGLSFNDSINNDIYHNNFIENSIQVQNHHNNINTWNNENSEGNHWSDYTGLDNGANGRWAGDGIGDTEIPHLGLDHYPFVNISGWDIPTRPKLFDPGEYSPQTVIILCFGRTTAAVQNLFLKKIQPKILITLPRSTKAQDHLMLRLKRQMAHISIV
jgi:parallel beta-helix repeat protein